MGKKGAQRLGRFIKVVSLFALVTTFLLIFNKLAVMKFDDSQFKSFGYTPIFFSIAKTTKDQGKYSNTLEGTTNLIYNGPYKNYVVEESQREPLLPIMLMLFENKHNFFILKIILLNLFLLISGAYLFRKEYSFFVIPFIVAPFFPTLIFYSQIFYPYQFGIFLGTLGLIFLSSGIFQIRLISFFFFSLASLERNIHLQILFISSILFAFFEILKNGIRQGLKWTIYFFLAICLISPFLFRNYNLGFLGMSKISGYALGYTYGHLCVKENFLTDQSLTSIIKEHNSDAGSLIFLAQKYIEELSYVKADKILEEMILACLEEKPRLIFENFKDNLINFNRGLFGYFKVSGDLKGTYINNLQSRDAVVLDWILFSILLLRLFLYLLRNTNFVSIVYVLLNMVFLIPIMLMIKFDGRYRGIIDVFIFFGACLFLSDLLRIIKFYFNKLRLFETNAN